jgi:hypothetical protein
MKLEELNNQSADSDSPKKKNSGNVILLSETSHR